MKNIFEARKLELFVTRFGNLVHYHAVEAKNMRDFIREVKDVQHSAYSRFNGVTVDIWDVTDERNRVFIMTYDEKGYRGSNGVRRKLKEYAESL
jgi:hypothetical protein